MKEIDDIKLKIEETCEIICDKFCKFNNTGRDNQCVWSLMHDGECPLDKLMEVIKE